MKPFTKKQLKEIKEFTDSIKNNRRMRWALLIRNLYGVDLLDSIKILKERGLAEPDTRFEDSIKWDRSKEGTPSNYTGD